MKQFYKVLLIILVFAAPMVVAAQSRGIAPSDSSVATVTPVTGCDSVVWYDSTYTESGEYSYIDSISQVPCTLELTINHSADTTVYDTACNVYYWNDTIYYDESGAYVDTLQTINGCDSIVTLHLTINHSSNSDTTVSDCGSFTWHGKTYTHSGDYTDTLTNAAQCDSIVTLHLTINHGTHNVNTVTACENYTWHDSTYYTSGTYTYAYTDSADCQSVDTLHLTIYPLPTPSIIGDTVVCYGQTTILVATGGVGFKWSSSPSDTNVTVSVGGGTYTVTVTDGNGCKGIDSITITELLQFSAGRIAQGNETYCEGDTGYVSIGNLLCASGGSGSIVYRWKENNDTIINNNDTIFHINIGGLAAGTHIYTREARDLTCSVGWSASVGQHLITVCKKPTLLCQGDSTQSLCFGDTITPVSYLYGGSAVTAVVSGLPVGVYTTIMDDTLVLYGIPSQTGVFHYTVTTVSGNVCEEATLSGTITVRGLPSVSIGGDTAFCQEDSVVLTASGAFTYVWGDSLSSQTITVDAAGTYTVTGIDSLGCSASASKTVSVNPRPNVSISGDSSFCQGSVETLIASGASTYIWNSGSADSSITVYFAGTYTVTGTSDGCSDTDSITVGVNPIYNIHIDSTICQGDTMVFFDDRLTATGVYAGTLPTVNGCDSVITLTLIVNPSPMPVIIGDNEICEGEQTTLTAFGGDSYSWSTFDTTNSITVSDTGTYYVTVYMNNCSASDSVALTVHPLPYVTIGGDSSFCEGYSTDLTASGATAYVWSNGATDSTITVNYAGDYTVTGTDANGCSNTTTETVNVNPTITYEFEYSGCGSYVWNDSTYYASGDYIQTFSASDDCDSVVTLHLTINNSLFTEVYVTECGEYWWNDSLYTGSGDYTQTYTSANRCDSIVTLHLTITPQIHKKNIVSKNRGGKPYILVYPDADLLYQWYRNGSPIPGATKQYYILEDSLDIDSCYRVEVRSTAPDSCGVMADCWFNTASQSPKLRILPNPNSGQFRLLLPEGAVSVQILNANGQVVMARKTDGDELLEMNTGLANGLYFVKTLLEDGSYNTEKLIINR